MPENVNTSVLEIQNDSELIEDDRPTMIKVDHVSMVFNMASEQLNSLKEYAIKLAKRELFFEGFKALDDVSFEVKKGDVFGIMGTNGSGKSTMLKIIAGVLEPSSGTCKINGNIAPLIELGAGFDMELTARENIYLNGALLGYSKDFINDHFDEIVDFAEIESFLDMPLKNYSSGMVARIAFAIATVIVPEILVVDEVLSVGDFMFQKKCEDRINELIEKHGVTVLIVSHSNEQIARLCNKAIWIEKGHTRLLGDASVVTRVYGGLGGRVGSKESENYIFNLLEEGLTSSHLGQKMQSKTISAGSAIEMNVKLVLEAIGEDVDSVVLVCNVTHINSIIANGFAALLNAPIMSFGIDYLSDAVLRVLFEKRPARIFVFDTGSHIHEVLLELDALPWTPEVVFFGEDDLLDFSIEVFEYGKRVSNWGRRAILVPFEYNVESIAIMPLLYSGKIPAFSIKDSHSFFDDFALKLKNGGITEIGVIGANVSASCVTSLEVCGIEVSRIDASSQYDFCREMASLQIRRFGEKWSGAISIAPSNLSKWAELLAGGYYCAKTATPLLLMDPANLDSMKNVLELIRNSRPSEVVFLDGANGLSIVEKEMCEIAISQYDAI